MLSSRRFVHLTGLIHRLFHRGSRTSLALGAVGVKSPLWSFYAVVHRCHQEKNTLSKPLFAQNIPLPVLYRARKLSLKQRAQKLAPAVEIVSSQHDALHLIIEWPRLFALIIHHGSCLHLRMLHGCWLDKCNKHCYKWPVNLAIGRHFTNLCNVMLLSPTQTSVSDLLRLSHTHRILTMPSINAFRPRLQSASRQKLL